MLPTERDVPISVIARASRLMESFDADHGILTLAELSRTSGLPRSTAHRIADELAELGWLEKTGEGYSLGMRMFEFGELVPRQRNLVSVAMPYMEDLRTATGASVHLAVLDGSEVVYLQVLASKLAPKMNSRRGGRLPAHATGVGKAMLAFSPPDAVQRVIDTGLPRLTARTISTPGQLKRELSAIRSSGIAYDREESNPGVLCAAVPIFGNDGSVRAGLSVSGFSRRVAPRMAPAVQTAALALARDLARQPWELPPH